MDIDHLKSWVGRSQTVEDRATAAPLAGLAATLDHDTPPWTTGAVPPLGHWLYFLPHARQSEISIDGHPKRGGFLPPVDLPRRMRAGGRVQFVGAIAVGAALKRVSTIGSVEAKTGKTGHMVFITVQHEIFADGTLAIREEEDIVYREAPKPGSAAPAAPAKPDARACDVTRRVQADPVLLFRYSALTFNGHRIHYDRDYCRDDEGYPGLVVHGPLLATLLADHFLRVYPAARVTGFSFRAQRPLFDIAPFDLCLEKTQKGADLWARNLAGETAVTATLDVG